MKRRVYLLTLFLLVIFPLKTVEAGNWSVTPEVSLRETYSDNINQAYSSVAGQSEYVTEVIPAIEILGAEKRLTLKGKYALQNSYYSKEPEKSEKSNRFSLDAYAELYENWIFIDVGGNLGRYPTASGVGAATDSLTLNSGLNDVLTTTVRTFVKHRFDQGSSLEMGRSESRVRYEDSDVEDARIVVDAFHLNGASGTGQFSWAFNYNRNEQWDGGALSSEGLAKSGKVYYQVLDRLSFVANGGKEEGSVSGRYFQQGSYSSIGALWVPNARFSLEVSSGENDTQGNATWAPTTRTLFGASYIDRGVGVRSGSEWTGIFSHHSRRTTWGLSYSKEMLNDSKLQLVGQAVNITTDEEGFSQLILTDLYGLSNEEFVRTVSQADFSFKSKKNEFNLVFTKEHRDYEVSARRGVTDGAVVSWSHYFGTQTESKISYSRSRKKENLLSMVKTNMYSVALSKKIGRRINTGLKYRRASLENGIVNSGYIENRVSVYMDISI